MEREILSTSKAAITRHDRVRVRSTTQDCDSASKSTKNVSFAVLSSLRSDSRGSITISLKSMGKRSSCRIFLFLFFLRQRERLLCISAPVVLPIMCSFYAFVLKLSLFTVRVAEPLKFTKEGILGGFTQARPRDGRGRLQSSPILFLFFSIL